MDIRSLFAAQSYAAHRSATEIASSSGDPTGATSSALRSFEETLQSGEQAALDSMAGRADPHALVHALAQSELAVETAVTLRNKVVEAYQEILRMPI